MIIAWSSLLIDGKFDVEEWKISPIRGNLQLQGRVTLKTESDVRKKIHRDE